MSDERISDERLKFLSDANYEGWEISRSEIRKMAMELLALRASHAELMSQLQLIFQQVTNGRVCYFGDHTGYEPQFSTMQVCRWDAALESARKVGA